MSKKLTMVSKSEWLFEGMLVLAGVEVEVVAGARILAGDADVTVAGLSEPVCFAGQTARIVEIRERKEWAVQQPRGGQPEWFRYERPQILAQRQRPPLPQHVLEYARTHARVPGLMERLASRCAPAWEEARA